MQFYVDVFGWLNVIGTTPKGQKWTKVVKIHDYEFEFFYSLFQMSLIHKKNEREEEQKKDRRKD